MSSNNKSSNSVQRGDKRSALVVSNEQKSTKVINSSGFTLENRIKEQNQWKNNQLILSLSSNSSKDTKFKSIKVVDSETSQFVELDYDNDYVMSQNKLLKRPTSPVSSATVPDLRMIIAPSLDASCVNGTDNSKAVDSPNLRRIKAFSDNKQIVQEENSWLSNTLNIQSDNNQQFQVFDYSKKKNKRMISNGKITGYSPDPKNSKLNTLQTSSSLTILDNNSSNRIDKINKLLKNYKVPEELAKTVTTSNNNIKNLLNEKLQTNYYDSNNQNSLIVPPMDIPKKENNKNNKNNTNKKNNNKNNDNKNSKISITEACIKVLKNSTELYLSNKEIYESIDKLYIPGVKSTAVNTALHRDNVFEQICYGCYKLKHIVNLNQPCINPFEDIPYFNDVHINEKNKIFKDNLDKYNIKLLDILEYKHQWIDKVYDEKCIIIALSSINKLSIPKLMNFVNDQSLKNFNNTNRKTIQNYKELLYNPYTNINCLFCNATFKVRSCNVTFKNITDYRQYYKKRHLEHKVTFGKVCKDCSRKVINYVNSCHEFTCKVCNKFKKHHVSVIISITNIDKFGLLYENIEYGDEICGGCSRKYYDLNEPLFSTDNSLPEKDILNFISPSTENDNFANKVNKCFKRYESHCSYVFEALSSCDKYFSKEEIKTYIKNNYPYYDDYNKGIAIFKGSIAINSKKNNNGKLVYYLNSHQHNMLPNYNNELFIKVINEYRNESLNNVKSFETDIGDINDLKESILMNYNNFMKRELHIERVYIRPNFYNDFIKEAFYPLFGSFPSFLNKYTEENLIVYTIINSFKLECFNSMHKLIRLYLSIKKSLNRDYIEYNASYLVTVVLKFLKENFKGVSNYKLFFDEDLNCISDKSHSNAYVCYRLDNDDISELSELPVVKKKEKNIFLDVNNKIILKERARVGKELIKSYFKDEFFNDLKQSILRQTTFSFENDILHCDHAIMRPDNSSLYTDGYTVGYCNQHINYLLSAFPMSLRTVIRVLNENNKSELESYSWQKLIDNVHKSNFDKWNQAIENEVDKLIEKFNIMRSKKLTSDQINSIFNYRKVTFSPNGVTLYKVNREDETDNNVFEHCHNRFIDFFNALLCYLNLSDSMAKSDDDVVPIYKSIKNSKNSNHAITMRYLTHLHVSYFGRDFSPDVSMRMNLLLGSYEHLLNSGWTENDIKKELCYMLSKSPLLDDYGNIILYFVSNKK